MNAAKQYANRRRCEIEALWAISAMASARGLPVALAPWCLRRRLALLLLLAFPSRLSASSQVKLNVSRASLHTRVRRAATCSGRYASVWLALSSIPSGTVRGTRGRMWRSAEVDTP